MVDQYDEESPLKLVSIPDGLEPNDDRSNVGKLCDSMLSTMPQALKKLIQDNDSRIRFIVVDLHVGWALNVACELGIKGALFWPASATAFHLLYSVPRLLHDGIIDPDGKYYHTLLTEEVSLFCVIDFDTLILTCLISVNPLSNYVSL